MIDQVVKAYDIRGLVGSQLDETFVRDVGSAYARVLLDEQANGTGSGLGHGGAVVVAHDMRESSPELAEAFAEGVTALGVDVVHIGLASTDMMYYASGALEMPGAMFTASHNPAAYNGIKLCRAGASPVGQDTGLDEIAALLDRGAGRGRRVTPRHTRHGQPPRHARRLRGLPALAGRPRRASADCRSSSTPATAWPATRCPR